MALEFEILSVPLEEVHEHRGRVQRRAGVRTKWHGHHLALRLTEEEFSMLLPAFRKAHPRFNYYGPTDYSGDTLQALCGELTSGGRHAQPATAAAPRRTVVGEVLALAEKALAAGETLLVLGI